MIKHSTLQKVEQLLGKKELSNVTTSSRQTPSRLTVSVSRENNPAGFPDSCFHPALSYLEQPWFRFSWSGSAGMWGRSGDRCPARCSWPSWWSCAWGQRTEWWWCCLWCSWWEYLQERDSKAQWQTSRINLALGITRSNLHQGLGVFSLEARGKHEEKQDIKKLRCGTTNVGGNCLTLVASVFYFRILRVRNK